MACDLVADLQQFPDAYDVVRVGSGRWSQRHTIILDALCRGVQDFLRVHRHLPLKKMMDQYEKLEPEFLDWDGRSVRLLYGRTGAFFIEDSQLKMDIRGLVVLQPRV